ncbi:tyrosine-type recombinase/integrase [Gloeocapsopsis crepidinum LEGE 06123]|uniref:Tyrosine-type recombinase/integrase n=1 Tax=Gloeocapsopsis crepidinum LEGE 06123 TaxID=588587 RepID=A0ABR9UZC9_9CHRO|nr:tyrosine-type recombinase/integrase [Gloeocapsopsis crepidinum]MBE9193355.1 tyrosine-type recombinase/integrase [Gloeocapsopsis crepidinum LEGE 06123]
MSDLLNLNIDADDWLTVQNTKDTPLLNNLLLQKDVWRTIEDLGLKVNEHDKRLTINFQGIEQNWLKLLAKLYVLVRSQRKISSSSLRTQVNYLILFSKFLQQKSVSKPDQINNKLFEELNKYLQSLKLAEATISNCYTSLAGFFDLCRQEDWLEVNTYWFKGKRKYSRLQNKIDYIPEEVWQQLNEYLHHLPEPIQRMVLIIRSTGLRIGELLNLPLDCLRQRGKQWRLRFLTEKYQVEDELPICPELVVVIREQQEYTRQHFGNSYDKLFSSNGKNRYCYKPTPRVMNARTFGDWLNKLAQEYNISTKDGQIWHFKSHQFRKTLATVMTNAGVRDLIIQKYLRHRSPDMQNYYKHLLKQALGDEYQKLMRETKYVDSTGKIVGTHNSKNPITELLRRKMYQITTQYGECHRPVLKSPCQTVNACWRCEHWRTSTDDLNALKDDSQRIEVELEIATKLGMVRQQQGLESDKHYLAIRIKGLEEVNG